MIATKLLLSILGIGILFSFTTPTDDDKNLIGVYGDKDRYEITINADHTFRFLDDTKNNAKIVSGTWERTDKMIHLKSTTKTSNFRSKWTLINNNCCLKSTKGLTIFTLCRIN